MNVTGTSPTIHAPAKQVSVSWKSYVIFTIFASIYLLPFMRFTVLPSDEGTFLCGAERIVQGQVFARDFFEVMGPGTFYWLTVFFKLFGVSFLAARICLFVSSLGTGLAVYFLSRQACTRYRTLPCLVLTATYFGVIWPGISHHVDSTFVALLSIVCLVLWNTRHRNILLISAGCLAGITTFIMQPKGALLFCAILVWFWLQRRRVSSFLSSIGLVTGGYLAIAGIVLVYFWSRGAVGSFVYANFVFPSQQYSTINAVAYAQGLKDYWNLWLVGTGGSNWSVGIAAILVTPFLFVAVLPLVLPALAIRYKWKSISPEIVLYWLCGWALWLSELHRKDIYHLVFGSPLLIILCFHILGQSPRRIFSLAAQVLAIGATCLAGADLLLVAAFAHPVSTRSGTVYVLRSDKALAFLNENVPPGEEILIYPYFPAQYFFSATTNPTRYSFLLYNYNTPSQFQEVVGILERRRVRYVVWDTTFLSRFTGDVMPGMQPKSSKDFILEPYLESHFRVVQDYSGVRIMERMGEGDAK